MADSSTSIRAPSWLGQWVNPTTIMVVVGFIVMVNRLDYQISAMERSLVKVEAKLEMLENQRTEDVRLSEQVSYLVSRLETIEDLSKTQDQRLNRFMADLAELKASN